MNNQDRSNSRGSASARNYMMFIAAMGSIGGLLFGYDTGIIASALTPMSMQFGLTTIMEQVVVSSILVGCIFGALGAGGLTDKYGRRPVIIGVGIVFAVAALLCSVTWNTTTLILFRFILGLSVGGASQVIPVYISELAPQSKRGGLVVVFQLAIIIGILISSVSGIALIGYENSWRWMIALGAIPAVILILAGIILPESPRYLFRCGKIDMARKVLTKVRGPQEDIDQEIEQIQIIEELDKQNTGTWSELFSPRIRPALIAGLGIAIFSQITGINAIIYYAPTILMNAGFEGTSGLWAGLINSIAILLVTILGMRLVDKWGRRKILLMFIPVSISGLLILAFSFSGGQTLHPWLTVTGMVCFAAFNGGSISVALWLVISEIFPLKVRGKATSVCAAAVWIADLLVSLTTLSLVEGLGVQGIFLLYTAISIAAFIFTYCAIPETKGRSLEEIEESLDRGKFNPLSGMLRTKAQQQQDY